MQAVGKAPRNAKDAIKRAALELFVEHGVDGTSTRAIAERAGCTEPAIYRHFPNKQGLVETLFHEHYSAFALRLDEAAAGAGDCAAELSAQVRAIAEEFDRDPLLFAFMLIEQHRQLGKRGADLPNPVEAVRDVFVRGAVAGTLRCDPDQAAAIAIGIVLQTATFHLYGRLPGRLADQADRLARCIWAAVTAA